MSNIELKIEADNATELVAKLESLLEARRYNNATLEQQANQLARENQLLRAIIEFLDHTGITLGFDASRLLRSIRDARRSS